MAKIQENIVRNSIPENLKEKGLAKLGTYITNEAMKFADRMIPTLEKQVREFIDQCPPSEKVERIVTLRNNVLTQANSISDSLDRITKTIGIANFGVNSLLTLIALLKTGKLAASVAAKFLPTVPGAIPSAISDLDDLITNKTFDIEGNSKIAPIKNAIDGISSPINLLSFYILQFVLIIRQLDNFIKDCAKSNANPNLQLNDISPNLLKIAEIQEQSNQSSNLSTYQGFVIEIEEVPFSPTVNRKRAVGKNQDGIVLIQTELSFTPSSQVLINELKFIIDRDNLKAY